MRDDNFQMPSGRLIDNGQIHYLRSLAKYESLQGFKSTPVREGLILEDVAQIDYTLSSSAAISH